MMKYHKIISYLVLCLGVSFFQQTNVFAEDMDAPTQCEFNRKIVKEISEDRFLVQDFFITGEKFTQPFVIESSRKLNVCNSDNVPYYFDEYSKDSLGIIGKLVILYKTGDKYSEQYFNEQGKREGQQSFWYCSGEKLREIYFKNGIITKESAWYISGQISSEFSYKGSIFIGMGTTWYQNGNIKNEMSFTPNKIDILEYKDGKKKSHKYYENHKLIKTIKWDKEGREIVVDNSLENKGSKIKEIHVSDE